MKPSLLLVLGVLALPPCDASNGATPPPPKGGRSDVVAIVVRAFFPKDGTTVGDPVPGSLLSMPARSLVRAEAPARPQPSPRRDPRGSGHPQGGYASQAVCFAGRPASTQGRPLDARGAGGSVAAQRARVRHRQMAVGQFVGRVVCALQRRNA